MTKIKQISHLLIDTSTSNLKGNFNDQIIFKYFYIKLIVFTIISFITVNLIKVIFINL